MLSLQNDEGTVYAKLDTTLMGETRHALVLVWMDPGATLPSLERAYPFFAHTIEELRERGASVVETRVITEQSGVEAEISGARARWHRSLLEAQGFVRGTDRVEFRIPLEEAISRLEADASAAQLTWLPIATEPGALIERAAALLRHAAVGDPDADPEDDPRGFLLARREDETLALPPECLQIGQLEGLDAAMVAPSVQPKTGWCTNYYLGVLPEYRGRGLGVETMRQGFLTMRSLGGQIYHDGTGANNTAALALFRRLGATPYRSMEQWRLVL